MKKIPCLFQRDFVPRKNGRGSEAVLREEFTLGLERVIAEGIATIKFDGTACAAIDDKKTPPMDWVPLKLRSYNRLYKRYDAKKGKPAPVNGIPCDDPDEVTGHWPHWVPIDASDPGDKWAREAYLRLDKPLDAGTYELCGPHVQGNPSGFAEDLFILHGSIKIAVLDRTFAGIRAYLDRTPVEGIVFWLDGQPRAKIRRKDFGFDWPTKRAVPEYKIEAAAEPEYLLKTIPTKIDAVEVVDVDPLILWKRKDPESAGKYDGWFIAVTRDGVLVDVDQNSTSLLERTRDLPNASELFVGKVD